mgnify:CR=1 FL=1
MGMVPGQETEPAQHETYSRHCSRSLVKDQGQALCRRQLARPTDPNGHANTRVPVSLRATAWRSMHATWSKY